MEEKYSISTPVTGGTITLVDFETQNEVWVFYQQLRKNYMYVFADMIDFMAWYNDPNLYKKDYVEIDANDFLDVTQANMSYKEFHKSVVKQFKSEKEEKSTSYELDDMY